MKYKVVLTEADLTGGWALEEQMLASVDAELVVLNSTDPAVIAEAAADADALVVSYAMIDADLIAKLKKCKSISKLGIGTNNIDMAAATAAGIRVMNAPNYCIEEVSDMIVAHMLSLTRGVPFYWKNIREGKWSREGCNTAMRLRGKVFGFMGYGKIRHEDRGLRPLSARRSGCRQRCGTDEPGRHAGLCRCHLHESAPDGGDHRHPEHGIL